MSHSLGRINADGRQVGPAVGTTSITLNPAPAPLGGPPRFVILHFTGVSLAGSDRLTVGADEFEAADGSDFWTRPIDPLAGPIVIQYVGSGAGGVATLEEYGSGEPTITGTPPGSHESQTNPDAYLHSDPYTEPIYETRGRSGSTFDWTNADSITDATNRLAVDATCALFFVGGHGGARKVSSCSGTLINTDLVVTSNHCFDSPEDLEMRSGSVTFNYMTEPDGSAPPGHSPDFHKITDIVARNAAEDWAIVRFALPSGGTGVSPRPLRSWPMTAGEPVLAVHHPNGAVKKAQASVAANSWEISGLDVAGGSSGGGVFDSEARLVIAAMKTYLGAGPSAPNVLDDLANPDPPPKPLDVVLVMDRSGSMDGPTSAGSTITKLDDAKESAELFVELVRAGGGDRIGLVSFSTSAGPPQSTLGAVTAAKKIELRGTPSTPGVIDDLVADGLTSIGDGLSAALTQLGSGGGTNDPVILLMTDGLQNRPPMISDVEGSLGPTRLCAIGFGREESLNGPLLSELARTHDGFYTRAADGLDLRKFFALCFGDIFGEGALDDPRGHIAQGIAEVAATPFAVCGEDTITAVVGWDDPRGDLDLVLTTPSGVEITSDDAGVESVSGRTWFFIRVPLPFGADRDGTWQLQVRRRPSSSEFPDRSALDYFTTIVADGGPNLTPLKTPSRLYTGDRLSPRVVLRNRDGTRPGGSVTLEIERLDGSLGALLNESGLVQPPTSGDPIDAFTASLQAVAAASGGTLPIQTTTLSFAMTDEDLDNRMEPDGTFGLDLDDITQFEGNYQLRAIAHFDGPSCHGTREATWSLHVEPGIDPENTTIDTSIEGVIRITPRDTYGSPLGPGRGDRFDLDGVPGTSVVGPPTDNGDGSYDIPVESDPGGNDLGVVVHQPGRPPVVITPPRTPSTTKGCPWWLCLLLVIAALVLALLLVLAL